MSEIPDLEYLRRRNEVDADTDIGEETVQHQFSSLRIREVRSLLAYVAQLQEALRLTLDALPEYEPESLAGQIRLRLAALLPAFDESNQQGPG